MRRSAWASTPKGRIQIQTGVNYSTDIKKKTFTQEAKGTENLTEDVLPR